jgi:hypothetical protein
MDTHRGIIGCGNISRPTKGCFALASSPAPIEWPGAARGVQLPPVAELLAEHRSQ